MSDAPITTQDRLNAYLKAEQAILEGQQVRMGDRYLAMPELQEVRKAITNLQAQLANEKASAATPAGSRRTFGALANFSGYNGRSGCE